MNKRAHKNSNKCVKKLLQHNLTIALTITLYLTALQTHIFSSQTQLYCSLFENSPYANPYQIDLSYRTIIMDCVDLLQTVGPHSPLILFSLIECTKRVYSKHFKNTKSRSYPTCSNLGEKMLLGIWTCNRKSINTWHKSKFGNQNFAWI